MLVAGVAGAALTSAVPPESGLRLAPLTAITLAQAANGLLLPLVAIFLLAAANDRRLLGRRVNGVWANAAGGLVTAVAVLLGGWGLLRALGYW